MIEEYVHEQQGVWKTLLSLAHNMNKHFPPHHPPPDRRQFDSENGKNTYPGEAELP